MKNKTSNEMIEDLTKSYNIQDTNIVLRLLGIKSKLAYEKNVYVSNEELLVFLNQAMGYDEMQVWLLKKELEGIELTMNDKLRKFLELKTDEDILVLYDIEQNNNENNLKKVRKMIEERNNKKF